MNLILNNWTKNNEKEFENYLFNKKIEEKVDWTRNIVNTNLKVFAIKSKDLDLIAKEILKGNFKSFLDLRIFSSLESMLIYGKIISKLKTYSDIEKYLTDYANACECWATCDVLKLNIKNNEKEIFNLAKKFLKSLKPFVRRIGIIIFFKFINTSYFDEVFEQIKAMEKEKEYYVNMAVAWLMCEAFIKYRDKTIAYINKDNFNEFTFNKFISKCQDSYRISKEDKNFLKGLKN